MKKVLPWAGSVLCGLIALCCLFALPASWGGLLFIIPAALLNPKFIKWAANKNIHYKWPIYAASIVLPLIVSIGVSAAYAPSQPPEASKSASSVNSSAVLSSAPASAEEVSSIPVPSAAASSQINNVPAVSNGAKLKVHYIDVGQGDSEFLELPNGQTMLIDAGNPENGTQIVNYVKGLGHNKIDYLVATHPHSDHIGGMAEVVDSLDIGSVYMPKKSTNTKTFEGLLSALQNKGLKINTAKVGVNIIKTGDLNIDILAPVNIDGNDLNQYSAVIKVTYGTTKFLFMGDAGQPSEEQISADVSADVLKVGHHGSKTASSQEFLNKVHPRYAVIEVGKGNSYGHPTAATLSKLQGVGATIYRTDNDGTIIFTSDAKTITIDKKASSIKQQAPPSTSQKSAGTVTKKSSGSSHRSAVVAPASGNDSTIVYITDTGSKYHTDGCRSLRKSKHAITLKEAKAEGYGPCGICHPPQ